MSSYVIPADQRYKGSLKGLSFASFWLDREGHIALVEPWQHNEWAREHTQANAGGLLRLGWLKVSSLFQHEFFQDLSCSQIDVMEQIYAECGATFDLRAFLRGEQAA